MTMTVPRDQLESPIVSGVRTSEVIPSSASEIARRVGIDSAEEAHVAWVVLSNVIGRQTGWRASVGALNQALAGMSHLELADEQGRKRPAPFPGVRVRPWPIGQTSMRTARLEPKQLGEMWSAALATDGFHATFPLATVLAFFPDEIWPAVVYFLRSGPITTNRYLEAYLRLLAIGRAPGGFRRTREGLATLQANVRSFMLASNGLAKNGYPAVVLAPWAVLPAPIDVDLLEAEESRGGQNDAPMLAEVRRALLVLNRAIDKKKRTKRGSFDLLRLLRDRSLLELMLVTGSRIEPVASATVGSVGLWRCPWDGLERPAFGLTNIKHRRYTTHIVVIPDQVYEHFLEYIEYAGIADEPSHPLWKGKWKYFDRTTGQEIPGAEGYRRLRAPSGGNTVVRRVSGDVAKYHINHVSRHLSDLVTRFSTRRRTTHSLRHLARQLARKAARAHVGVHDDEPEYVTDEIIARALLGHQFKAVTDAYDEVNKPENKYRLIAIAAAGIWDLVAGEAGARRGLDGERILRAKRRLGETQAEMSASEERIGHLDEALARIGEGDHELQKRIVELQRRQSQERRRVTSLHRQRRLSDEEYRTYLLGREDIEDETEQLRDELVREERRLNRDLRVELSGQMDLSARLDQSNRELDDAVAVRVPLPDDDEPYDIDTRLAELLDGIPTGGWSPPEAELPLAREKLTLAEYAEAMGIRYSTLTRLVRAALASNDGFAFRGGAANPRQPFFQPIEQILEVHSDKKRYIVFTALDLSKYHPTQIQRMKEILSRPL